MIVIGEMVGPVVAMEVVTSGNGVDQEDVIVAVSVIVVQVFKVAGDVIHRAMQAAPFSPAAQGSKMLEHIAKNAKLGNMPMVPVRPVSIVRQAHLPMVQERPPASTVRPGHIWRQLETMICPIASHVLLASTHSSMARRPSQRVWPAVRASTGWKQEDHPARPAGRASTGLLQEDPRRHRARPVVRASTGLLQDKLLKHRVRPAGWASTGLLQDKLLKHPVRPAGWASTGLLQDKLLKHRAPPAVRASTGLL
jgi:hypothetical protein